MVIEKDRGTGTVVSMEILRWRVWQAAVLCVFGMFTGAWSVEGVERVEAVVGGFRLEEMGGKSVAILEGNKRVLVYNYGMIESPGLAGARPRSAYLHPVYGLDGEVLTDDFPKDHSYHRGVYWAWSHVKVDDAEYDSWSLRGIRTELERWLVKEARAGSAVLEVENSWQAGGRKLMKEWVRIESHPATEASRAIDVELRWTPVDRPVTLVGAEGKSYGGFTFRYGPRTKTVITIPEGRAPEDLLMTKMTWADFSADFKGAGAVVGREAEGVKLSGAAVFVHRSHPDYPPMWMTRHYGVLAVGWPGVTPRTLQAGETIICRYRIWVHRGNPEAAVIQKAYEDYVTSEAKR